MFLGNGNGTFQPALNINTGNGPSSVTAADFNGDGRLDLAVANATDSTVSIFLQTPTADITAGALDFGSQPLGIASSSQTLTLSNNGTANLNISDIAMTGANASDFSQTNNCGSMVGIGASCTISVAFTPTQVGSESAVLAVTDDAAGSPHNITLSGNGTGPSVSLSTNNLLFPDQMVGTASGPMQVTLSNVGSAPLNLASIASSGDFAQTNDCGTVVAAGGSCTITVTFTPNQIGPENGTVTINDDAAGSPQSILLSGNGT